MRQSQKVDALKWLQHPYFMNRIKETQRALSPACQELSSFQISQFSTLEDARSREFSRMTVPASEVRHARQRSDRGKIVLEFQQIEKRRGEHERLLRVIGGGIAKEM